jgi:hypothetical protein
VIITAVENKSFTSEAETIAENTSLMIAISMVDE